MMRVLQLNMLLRLIKRWLSGLNFLTECWYFKRKAIIMLMEIKIHIMMKSSKRLLIREAETLKITKELGRFLLSYIMSSLNNKLWSSCLNIFKTFGGYAISIYLSNWTIFINNIPLKEVPGDKSIEA